MDEKTRYEEIGKNYRFFLTWRQILLGGYFAILYGVFSLAIAIYENMPSVTFIVPFLTFPIGIIFWYLDIRNRQLYNAAINAGVVIEGEEGGIYSNLKNPKPDDRSSKLGTHTKVIGVIYLGSSIALFLIFFMLLAYGIALLVCT